MLSTCTANIRNKEEIFVTAAKEHRGRQEMLV